MIQTLPDHMLTLEQKRQRRLENERKLLEFQKFRKELGKKKAEIREEISMGRKGLDTQNFSGQQLLFFILINF